MKSSFNKLVNKQIEILNAGLPLDAFDNFYSDEVVMYSNDTLFATGKIECRNKQEPFISPCTSIKGLISKHFIDEENLISVIHNQTSFEHPKMGSMQVNGIHIQYWKNDKIIKELYFQGDKLQEQLDKWFS